MSLGLIVIHREVKLARLARAFSAYMQPALLLPSVLSSNLGFLVFSFLIHVHSCFNSGCEEEMHTKNSTW